MATASALDRVRGIFTERFRSGTAPSLVYGVLDGGELVDSDGFGSATLGGPSPTVDTAYRIASMTKSFTATVLLQLRDRGALSLDDLVADHVPAVSGVRLPTVDSPPLTLRMLATMSGGLPTDDPWGDRMESLTDDELDAVLRAGIRGAWVPGTTFAYSNLGYALLGRAIAGATGRPYIDVVHDDVLAPLGLHATGFTDDVAAPDGLAIGHRRHGDAWEPLPFSGPGAFSSIGGMFSTVRDIVRWMQVHVAAWNGGGGDVLSAASRREMQQVHRLVPPTAPVTLPVMGYGYGLFIAHDAAHGLQAGHSGGYPGFSSYMRWSPATGLGVVAFENATYSGVGRPVGEALDLLVASVGIPPVEPWPETLAAQDALHGLLTTWDDAVAARWFSPNVDLDVPLTRRRDAIAALVAEAGPLAEVTDATSASPSERRGKVRGAHGTLVCELVMDPCDPPRVQTFTVRADAPPL